MIEAVVFDLDGVLVDSEPVWEQVRRQFVAAHGGHWAPDAQQRLMGMSTGEWARYLSHGLGTGLPPEEVAAQVIGQMEARYREQVPFLPGAVAAVRRLAARWPLGLASSSPPVLIDAVLDGAGLRECFTAAMSTEQVPHGKPAPDIYLAVASRLGRTPQRCAAVEDSVNGIRSAAAAGLQAIAIPHPQYPPGPAALASARLVLTGLDDLTVQAISELATAELSDAAAVGPEIRSGDAADRQAADELGVHPGARRPGAGAEHCVNAVHPPSSGTDARRAPREPTRQVNT